MSEEEEHELPARLDSLLNNTAIVPIIFLLFVFRPEGGYIKRIEFLLFLIENGLLLENFFTPQIIGLLPLLIIIPLMFYRERVSAGMNNFLRFQIAKDVIKKFDEDGDEKLTKEESQGFFSSIMEDLEEEKWYFDSDALFDKHDSNKDGKLDGDEISSLILELFHNYLRNEVTTQTPSSRYEPVKENPSEDEMQKLDRLYNEGYLSKERYNHLKQDLSR